MRAGGVVEKHSAPRIGTQAQACPWARFGPARRLAPTLRVVGVDVTFDREPNQKRRRIIRLAQDTSQASHESQTPEAENESDEREQEKF